MRNKLDEMSKFLLIMGAISFVTILIGLYIERNANKTYTIKTIIMNKPKGVIMKTKTKPKDCIICFGKDKHCKACKGTGKYFPSLAKHVISEMIHQRICDVMPKKKLTKKDMKKEVNVLVKALLYMRRDK